MFVRFATVKVELNFYAFMLESFYVSVQIFSRLIIHHPNSNINYYVELLHFSAPCAAAAAAMDFSKIFHGSLSEQ